MNSKFIINNIICFDADDFTVTSITNNTCRCLAGVKGRCLLVLLESKDNEVTTKKQLHFDVWEKFGFYSNDNCLLQTIYSLRKELKQLGLEDIILTSPRLGYKINPNYEISILSEKLLSAGEAIEMHNNCLVQQYTEPPVTGLESKSAITMISSRVPPPVLKSTMLAVILFSLSIILYIGLQEHDVYLIGSKERISRLESMHKDHKINTKKYLQTCKPSDIESTTDADVFICNSDFENQKIL